MNTSTLESKYRERFDRVLTPLAARLQDHLRDVVRLAAH